MDRAGRSVGQLSPSPKPQREQIRDAGEGEADAYLEEANEFPTRKNEEDETTGLKFPLLEEPMKAFKLLLGQDVDLFTLQLPRLEVGFGTARRSRS